MSYEVGNEEKCAHDGKTNGDIPFPSAREWHPPLERSNDDLKPED